MNKRGSSAFRFVLLFFAVITAIGFFTSFGYQKINSGNLFGIFKEEEKSDLYSQFVLEVFDGIKNNYWEKMQDKDLFELFRLAVQKTTGEEQNLETDDRQGLIKLVQKMLDSADDARKKELITQTADVVLANLQPFARSRLFSAKQEKELRNAVSNIDPEKDLYALLNLAKGAPTEAIEENYREKIKELEGDKSPAAQKKIEELTYAKEVLADDVKKGRYDETGAEPTVFAKIAGPKTLYIKITKFSPATLEEFVRAADGFDDQENLSSLILDLRGNVGGAIDLLQYFLGPFIGNGQYAYEFYHQGEYTPYKTKVGWLPSLVKYKKVVILVDGGTQSSAEVMAATLKKYNVGILVGATTKGWGTVENTFPISTQFDNGEKYALFLVHSVTLRDDGEPIEGRGIDPVINMADKNWASYLNKYFDSKEFVELVGDIWREPSKL